MSNTSSITPAALDAKNALIGALQQLHLEAFRGGSHRGQRIAQAPSDEIRSIRLACDQISKQLENISKLVESLVAAFGIEDAEVSPYAWRVGINRHGSEIIIEPSQSGGWCFQTDRGYQERPTLVEAIALAKVAKAEGWL